MGGNVEGVRRLLQHGVNVNKINHHGHTAMRVTIDHLLDLIDIKSAFESGAVRSPAGEILIKETGAYILLEVIQLLISYGGTAEGDSNISEEPPIPHTCGDNV